MKDLAERNARERQWDHQRMEEKEKARLRMLEREKERRKQKYLSRKERAATRDKKGASKDRDTSKDDEADALRRARIAAALAARRAKVRSAVAAETDNPSADAMDRKAGQSDIESSVDGETPTGTTDSLTV